MPDLRDPIRQSLAQFARLPLRKAATELLATLGYRSDRTLDAGDSRPEAFLDFVREHAGGTFRDEKALVSHWVTADLLFQLTDDELAGRRSLFEETAVQPSLLRSYVFFAIELEGEGYSRGALTGLARQINRVFPMPVMVLIKHRSGGEAVLSIAVINRRANKRDESKDVLGKVAIIRDVRLEAPHRGHLDILDSLARPNLVHPQRLPVNTFDALHAAWEEIFNVELLNERFYRELSNWYFWALPQIEFPDDTQADDDDEKWRSTSLIRLLTRTIFCWFIKEKGLVPEGLFNRAELDGVLVDLDPASSTYYQAILQNLFFATLNRPMGRERGFARDEGFQANRATHGVDTLYRYEEHFRDPEEAVALFADVPFLNGGLFESLDFDDEATGTRRYVDGFTRRREKRPHVPNTLFFAERQTVDLSDAFGEKKRSKETVRGLLHILHGYTFTIVENTPIDQEIALDPELLGKVFENLLASYNEETKTTARKQTGSFYTPRPLVEYMVDEALKARLGGVLTEAGMDEEGARIGLDILFAYTEKEHPFVETEVDALLAGIHASTILDPACGSGAFPMGVLQKLVHIIHKLDPDNAKWEQIQILAASDIPDASAREAAITAIERDFRENDDDYGRKLYLIENCLYGVDIQPVAIQISKLRFFISLVADQRTNRDKAKNRGVRPLPNLETKFVAADTLTGLPESDPWALVDPQVPIIERDLQREYHRHFGARTRREKRRIQTTVRELRKRLAQLLSESLGSQQKAAHVAEWDPFASQTAADFFDPHWMFGRELAEGFDIVIGNPPYISVETFSGTAMQASWKATYETYAGRGDVYCLFYERGAQLLRPGGVLVYITSNKWMRAGYGRGLRSFLSKRVNTETVLDFGMAQNFGAATTYTCVTRLTREVPDGVVRSVYASDDEAAVSDPAGYLDTHAVELTDLSDEPWVILTKDRQRIKDLVEMQGTPLTKWDIKINYGIKTGYNDAFYLSPKDRQDLIDEHPESDEVIGRLLRGRDVGRYEVEWSGLYQLIVPFGAYEYLEDRYPAVYRHLRGYEKELKARGQAKAPRTKKQNAAARAYPGQHHWLELDNNLSAEFVEQFSSSKLMYPNMTSTLSFYMDYDGGYFINDKGYIITSITESLPYLASVLSSSLFACCFKESFPELMGNTYEIRKSILETIPIRKPSESDAELFEALVPIVQFARAADEAAPAQFFESVIDACVMECYFHEHMAKRDLLFHEALRPHVAVFDPSTSVEERTEVLLNLYQTLNAPEAPVRNRLLRISAESPDLLAIIQEEGHV